MPAVGKVDAARTASPFLQLRLDASVAVTRSESVFTPDRKKAWTTKGTKHHQGIQLRGFSSCTFVTFVVEISPIDPLLVSRIRCA